MSVASYWYRLQCNAPPRRWRDRIATQLRELADRFDGRCTLAVEMASDPAVPAAVRADVCIKGLEHMTRLYADAVAAECMESMLMKRSPHMFDAGGGTAAR